MSELNLTFFMLLGYAQAHWFIVLLFVVGAAGLNYTAWVQKGAFFNRDLLKQTAIGFGGLFVFLCLTLPAMTGSSLTMLGYWVDWILLIVMAAGYAFAISLWVYPILRLREALKPAD